MARKRSSSKTRSSSKRYNLEAFLVPQEIRQAYERIAFCVDVWLDQADLDKLSAACNQGEKYDPDKFNFSGSSRNDPSVALHIRQLRKEDALHISVECRPKSKSPHDFYSKTTMNKIRAILFRGSKFELVAWLQSITVDMAMPKVTHGTKLQLSGATFQVVDNDGQSDVEMRIDKRENGVAVAFSTTKRRKLLSFKDVFDTTIDMSETRLLSNGGKQ